MVQGVRAARVLGGGGGEGEGSLSVRVLAGDCRDVLRSLPDQSVHCCVTSPPYYGLRDYGWEGQIGLEETPDAYVAEMVEVFREVRRVLRDEGVLFLNLGDSYSAGGTGTWKRGNKPSDLSTSSPTNPKRQDAVARGGARRAIACDTLGKEPAGSSERGCFCQSLCDACRAAYRIGIAHSGRQHDATPLASNSASTPARRAVRPSRPPTSGSAAQPDHIETATQDQPPSAAPADEPLRASQASTPAESSPPRPEGSRQSGQSSECRLCGCSLPDSALASAGRAACSCDTAQRASASDIAGTDAAASAYPGFTRAALKPKDLIGIPWMVAFALRDDGWYLRQDIIWSKPNPMPESVTDRPTKAHEYLFLLSKSPRYYYDAGAIAEPAIYSELSGQDASGYKDAALYGGKHTKADATPRNDGERWNGNNGKGFKKSDKQRGHSRRHAGFNDRWDAMEKAEQCADTRNKRSVWTVATKPFPEAHFATFPPALIEPCILAGCPTAGVVLDPFGGAGTTALVAERLQRNSILIELNSDYCAMMLKRLHDDMPLFSEVEMVE